MNKILSKKVSYESVIAVFGFVVVILGIIAINYYKKRSEFTETNLKSVIVQSVKDGVNRDSLKKVIYQNDSLYQEVK